MPCHTDQGRSVHKGGKKHNLCSFHFHANVRGWPEIKLVGHNNNNTCLIMSHTSLLEASSITGYKSGTCGLKTEPVYTRTHTLCTCAMSQPLRGVFFAILHQPLLSPGAHILMYSFTSLVHRTCKYL